MIHADICYYVGAAYDIINPILNTNCKTLVCIDLIDPLFYPAILQKHGHEREIKSDQQTRTNIHLYSIINRFAYQWDALKVANVAEIRCLDFGDILNIVVSGNRFSIDVIYKEILRRIIFYSGVSDKDFTPPEISYGVDVLYISMALPDDSTILKISPKYILIFSTTKSPYLQTLEFNKIDGVRLNPWIDDGYKNIELFEFNLFSKGGK